jgi:hypothetical protein
MPGKVGAGKKPVKAAGLTRPAIPAISGPKMMQEQPILIISCGIILG